MEEKYCPCCGRHCSLDEPHCGRGEAFAKTGSIENVENGEGRAEHDKRFEDRKRRYRLLDTDNKLICNIRDLGHTVRAMSDGKASQSRILIILLESNDITQSELTERLGVQSGTVSEVLSKLERAGYIVRAENGNDKRTCCLRLTDEGRLRATEANAERNKRYGEMFAGFSAGEKADLLVALEKLNTDWQRRYGDKRFARHGEHGHCGEHGRHGGHDRGHEGHFGRKHTEE